MKSFIAAIFLMVSLCVASADTTNGVFYIDQSVECRLLAQNGDTTNILTAGKTYMDVTGTSIVELNNTNKTTYYFSGGLVVQAAPSSVFSIDVFDQDVKNLAEQPRKAVFGSHNISLTFTKGEFAVIYPQADNVSSLTINTPYAAYQMSVGKFLFRVSEKSAIGYVGEGMMQVHGDKNKVDTTDKGKLAVAIPFQDSANGMTDKILTSIKSLKPEDTANYIKPLVEADKKTNDIQFVVIGGRVLGVLEK